MPKSWTPPLEVVPKNAPVADDHAGIRRRAVGAVRKCEVKGVKHSFLPWAKFCTLRINNISAMILLPSLKVLLHTPGSVV
jgi:hypothetical protein